MKLELPKANRQFIPKGSSIVHLPEPGIRGRGLPFDIQHSLFDIRYFLCSPVSYYNIFPDTQIMQNKANLVRRRRISNERKINDNNGIRKFGQLAVGKNKANTNPILSAAGGFKAKTKPIQTQFVERGKMLEFTLDVSSLAFLSGAFAWIKSFTIVLIMLLAEFTTLRVPISSEALTH